jgi:hypothetical protein
MRERFPVYLKTGIQGDKNIRKRNERVSANPALVKALAEIKIGTQNDM